MDEHDYQHSHSSRHSIFWPLFFIIIGILWLLSTINVISNDVWDLFLRLWPLIFVLGGIDSIFRGSHYVGAMVGIGIGSVLTLSNLGYLVLSWQMFFSLWPVLLIAFGLDIIIGRRSAWGAVIGILLGIVLILSVVWLVVSAPWVGQVNQFDALSQTLNGANKATVELANTVGAMRVGSGASTGNLIDAQLRHFSNETTTPADYVVQGGRGYYEIKTHGYAMYPAPAITSGNPDWDVKLSSKIPLELDSNLVVGDQRLDMSELKIDNLNAESVMGRMEVTLPQQGFKQGRISLVMGQVVVYVPRGANVHIIADTVLVPVSFPAGFERNGKDIVSTGSNSGQPMQLDISDVIGVVSIQYK
jgi:hypothetical protein